MPPAARVTDPHVCPAFTGPVPHVGGPILPPGCPTVLIDFLPAARMTDMVTCVGPPSTILKGSTGVFIGGLPAARLGDPTAHGGTIVFGAPNVIIGEIGSGAPGISGFNAVVAGLVASIPPDQDSSWLSRFGKGLFDSTLAPLGHMITHPVQTVEGIGHAVAHPVQTAKALGHAVSGTAKGVAAGDAHAIGVAVGTVGMIAIPGAGEAEGAEDAARLGKMGEVGEEAGAASEGMGSAWKLSDTAPLQDTGSLKAQYPNEVQSLSTFKTNGISQSAADNYLQTASGQRYTDELQSAAPSADDATIYARAQSQLQTGSAPPVLNENFTGPLVKIVPQGQGVSSYSPFFTTPETLNQAAASGRPLGDAFGLPLASQADTYNVYTMTPPAGGGTVFSSPVAPTSELGGQFTTQGGATQYLVPNRAGWSEPVNTGSIANIGTR